MRNLQFQNENFYHIYNRGVDKRVIFNDKYDYLRFLNYFKELNQEQSIESIYRLNQRRRKKLVEEAKLLRSADRRSLASFVCYNLLPNHFHICLQQLVDKGVERLMHKIGTAYTKYFNYKYKRSGSLFQGTYRAIEVKSDSYLFYLSCYINGNVEIHKISKVQNWPWSSYLDFIGKRKNGMCSQGLVLNQFKDINEYKDLVTTVINESGTRKEEVKKYLLEE